MLPMLTLLFLFLWQETESARPELAVTVPRVGPIVLDGTVEEAEWTGARTLHMVRGAKVRLSHHDDVISVAIEGPGEGWSHVCLSDGQTVLVLHSSASLGTAIYVRGETGDWSATQEFEWALWKIGVGEEADAERDAFFDQHGWVATTVDQGDAAQAEYRIARGLFRTDRLWATAVFAQAEKVALTWPTSTADSSRDARLVFGDTPSSLIFDPASWGRLVFMK